MYFQFHLKISVFIETYSGSIVTFLNTFHDLMNEIHDHHMLLDILFKSIYYRIVHLQINELQF